MAATFIFGSGTGSITAAGSARGLIGKHGSRPRSGSGSALRPPRAPVPATTSTAACASSTESAAAPADRSEALPVPSRRPRLRGRIRQDRLGIPVQNLRQCRAARRLEGRRPCRGVRGLFAAGSVIGHGPGWPLQGWFGTGMIRNANHFLEAAAEDHRGSEGRGLPAGSDGASQAPAAHGAPVAQQGPARAGSQATAAANRLARLDVLPRRIRLRFALVHLRRADQQRASRAGAARPRGPRPPSARGSDPVQGLDEGQGHPPPVRSRCDHVGQIY